MANVSIARRYARALLDVASDGNLVDQVAAELSAFAHLIDASSELRDLAQNPAYTRSQRASVVDSLISAMGRMSMPVQNLLKLLVERNRLASVVDIARLFRDMADARAGRVRGKVTSAVPLSAEALSKLEQTLERLTQRDVVLEPTVDPSLLGGISAQVGSLLYDGSLRTHLQSLRSTLRQR